MADVNVDIIKIDTSQATSSMGNLKKELKDTRTRMIELRMAGEETSEEYKNLAQKAGDLSRAMRLAANDVNEASTTFTNTVKYVSGSLAGVSGAVQACTGALSLMGVEMGNDSKLMKMLVAAMSVTSGLQAIQSSVEAFKLLATNIKRSTLAQQGLNAAFKASPVGWIVGGITALTAALTIFINKAHDAEMQELALKKAMIEQAEAAYEAAKTMGKEAVDDYVNNLQEKKKIWKAQGESELQATQHYQKEITNKLQDQVEKRSKILKEFQDAGGFNYAPSELPDNLKDMQNALDAYNSSIAALQEEANKTANEIKLLQTQAATDARKKAQQEAEAREKENEKILKDEQATLDKIIESLKSEEEQEIDALTTKYEAEKALMEKYGKDTTELTEKYNQDYLDIQQKYIDLENQEMEEANQKRKEEAADRIDIHELELLEEYYKRRLEIINSGEDDIENRLKELEFTSYDNQLALLEESYNNQLITTQEYETKKLQIESEMAEKRIQIKRDEAEKKEAIEKQYLQSIQSITNSVGGIIGSLGDMMEEGTEEQKNLKAAQAIINTIAGAVAAFMGITESTGGWGIAAAIAQAAAVMAAGMAQVQQIYAVNTDKNSKNSTSSNVGVSTGSVSTLTQNYNNTRLLANGGGVYDLSNLEQQEGSTRVYVLTSDIQQGLDRVNVTTSRNRF